MNFCFYLVQLNSILNNRSEENLIKTKSIFTDILVLQYHAIDF